MGRLGTWRLGLAVMLLLAFPQGASAAGAEDSVAPARTEQASRAPEPSGYRTDEYRSPTPAGLNGAITIDTAAAKALFDEGTAVFVDVLPRAPRPKGLPASTVWRPKARKDIPGSIWLVDTGYGEIAPVMRLYLLDGLEKATGGDRTRPLVFYCLRDCWMSWNAAKRAMAEGYTSVHWYPDGTDGWSDAGLPLETREPEARPDE